jgi:hypothetical protein
MIIYSTNPEADRAFNRDVLKFPSIEAGEGWLIFELPPAELAFHPAQGNGNQEFYLVCDDIDHLAARMKSLKVKCSEVLELSWGLLTRIRLPGGGDQGIYQTKHACPKPM